VRIRDRVGLVRGVSAGAGCQWAAGDRPVASAAADGDRAAGEACAASTIGVASGDDPGTGATARHDAAVVIVGDFAASGARGIRG